MQHSLSKYYFLYGINFLFSLPMIPHYSFVQDPRSFGALSLKFSPEISSFNELNRQALKRKTRVSQPISFGSSRQGGLPHALAAAAPT